MSLTNSDAFLATLARYPQVKTIVFGHAHQEATAQFQHVHIYGTPSTCTQFKPESQTFALDELAAGYRILDLHDDGHIETCVKRIGD